MLTSVILSLRLLEPAGVVGEPSALPAQPAAQTFASLCVPREQQPQTAGSPFSERPTTGDASAATKSARQARRNAGVRARAGGRWREARGGAEGGVRCWAGEQPRSCRVVEKRIVACQAARRLKRLLPMKVHLPWAQLAAAVPWAGSCRTLPPAFVVNTVALVRHWSEDHQVQSYRLKCPGCQSGTCTTWLWVAPSDTGAQPCCISHGVIPSPAFVSAMCLHAVGDRLLLCRGYWTAHAGRIGTDRENS